MPKVILCEHCLESLDTVTDEFVVIEKETDDKPGKYAHVKCHRNFIKGVEDE